MENHCWRCGSPCHRRPACRADVTEEEEAATRKEFKRLQKVMNPQVQRPYRKLTPPNDISLPALEKILEQNWDKYDHFNKLLDEIGKSHILSPDKCYELYIKHKNLNDEIVRFRQSDNSMSSFRHLDRSKFSNDAQRLAFQTKLEDVTKFRNKVWEKTGRLLVWAKCSITLSLQFQKTRESLRMWVFGNRPELLWHPKENLPELMSNIPARRKEMDDLENVWTEMRRICSTDIIEQLDEQMKVARTKVDDFLQLIHRKQWELDKEKREMEVLLRCQLCKTNRKEFLLPCSHLLCEACILNRELQANFPAETEGDFMPQTKPVCPLCDGPLVPRIRVEFDS